MSEPLTTLGAGFVRSHLADKLEQGDEVTVIDDFSNGFNQSINHVPADLIKADASKPTNSSTQEKLVNKKFNVIQKSQ